MVVPHVLRLLDLHDNPSANKQPLSSEVSQPVSPVKPGVSVNSSSQVELLEPVTTETSDDVSREPTPSREIEDAGRVRLSLWLQWTLPKFLFRLYGSDQDGKGMLFSWAVNDKEYLSIR